jgi:hypothetical protein
MSARHGTDEDLRALLAAQREPATADLKQTRPAGLQHAQPTAGANTQLGQTANPGRLTRHLGHVSPFARTQQFHREESFQIHGWFLGQPVGISRILVETESQSNPHCNQSAGKVKKIEKKSSWK